MLAACLANRRPVVFVVRIDRAGSRLRPGQPGNDVKELLIGQPDLLIAKHATSCLHTRSFLTRSRQSAMRQWTIG